MTKRQKLQTTTDYMRFHQYSDAQIVALLLAKQKAKTIKEVK